MEKNKVNLRICGSEYIIVGEESKEYIETIGKYVDAKMQELADSGNLKPIKASVLTAINICDEYFKTKDKLNTARDEIASLRDENTKLKAELQTFEEEKRFLKDELYTYRKNGKNQ